MLQQEEELHADSMLPQHISDPHHPVNHARFQPTAVSAGAAAGVVAAGGLLSSSGPSRESNSTAAPPVSGELPPEGPVHVFHSNNTSALTVASVPQSPNMAQSRIRFLDQQGSQPELPQPTARARPALSRRSAAPICMHEPSVAAPAAAQGAALAGV